MAARTVGRNPNGTFMIAPPMPERVLGLDRNLSVDEIGRIKLVEHATSAQTRA
jgi:hypothetical protein